MGSMVQEIGTSLGDLCEHVEKLNTNVNKHVEKLNNNVNEQVEKLNISVNEMKTGLTAVENRLEEMENKFENRFEEMQNRFKKVENQFLNAEDRTFRDQQCQSMNDERESARSDQATPVDPKKDDKDAANPNEYAYVVAGGYDKGSKPLNSAEIFDKTTNSWIELKPLNKSRANASSVVYNGQVLVTGGTSANSNILSSIEKFSTNPNPLVPPCWSNFAVNLPRTLKEHRTVLYHDRMFVIGGYDEEKKDYSNIIYEIQLHFPFTTKVLAKLPSSIPMRGCGIVLVNDKILIFGGASAAKVIMYDITKNEVKKLAPLPYKVFNMATVKYEENVILAGGLVSSLDDCRKNTVVSYNIETEKSAMLPPMENGRSECCAVVDGNTLVVMGGESMEIVYDRRGRESDWYTFPLDSVEAFDFKTSKWRNLPSMNAARKGFIAEIV
jgi:N-acetylneuraminic acid mutarotase